MGYSTMPGIQRKTFVRGPSKINLFQIKHDSNQL